MPRLVVVLPLLPLRPGNGFPLRTWPLHVTVAPTFVTDADAVAVGAAIAPVIARTAPLPVTAGPQEGFGPSGRVPVTVVVPTRPLTDLHRRLLTALAAVDAVFDDPQYTGAGYRAHVTATAGEQLPTGVAALLHQAAVVDMEPVGPERLRQVVWVSALAGTLRRATTA